MSERGIRFKKVIVELVNDKKVKGTYLGSVTFKNIGAMMIVAKIEVEEGKVAYIPFDKILMIREV